jgi:stage II sporulation protein D
MIEIAIFVLFHPQALTVKPAPGHILTVNGVSLAGDRAVGVRREGREVDWFMNRQTQTGQVVRFGGEMLVSLPGKIERRYRGQLTVTAAAGELRAVLKADLEDAVAAVTESESAPEAGLEARKAQAVIARSWFWANRRRHLSYDYCDSTHCQVFKDPRPSPATVATRGMVVTYQGKVFAPAYSASCGGRTKTAAEVGWSPEPYPYFAVDCEVCQREELAWERPLPELPRRVGDEAARLLLGRKFGWDTLPSNTYTLTGNVARGRGRGHGVGFCQRGAAGLAEAFDQTLRRYLPNTRVERLPGLRP